MASTCAARARSSRATAPVLHFEAWPWSWEGEPVAETHHFAACWGLRLGTSSTPSTKGPSCPCVTPPPLKVEAEEAAEAATVEGCGVVGCGVEESEGALPHQSQAVVQTRMTISQGYVQLTVDTLRDKPRLPPLPLANLGLLYEPPPPTPSPPRPPPPQQQMVRESGSPASSEMVVTADGEPEEKLVGPQAFSHSTHPPIAPILPPTHPPTHPSSHTPILPPTHSPTHPFSHPPINPVASLPSG